jgi:hypothetical protein
VNGGGAGAGFAAGGGPPDRFGAAGPDAGGVVCGVAGAGDGDVDVGGADDVAGVAGVDPLGTDCPGVVCACVLMGSASPITRARPLHLVYHGWATRL